MNASAVTSLRLRSQRLAGEPLRRPQDVVAWLGAVQAQDYAGAKWALSQRTAGAADAADIDRLLADGALLRSHVMRPTWHFVAPADIRWLLALTGPRVHAANGHYYRQLELDDAIFARSEAVIAERAKQAWGERLDRLERRLT